MQDPANQQGCIAQGRSLSTHSLTRRSRDPSLCSLRSSSTHCVTCSDAISPNTRPLCHRFPRIHEILHRAFEWQRKEPFAEHRSGAWYRRRSLAPTTGPPPALNSIQSSQARPGASGRCSCDLPSSHRHSLVTSLLSIGGIGQTAAPCRATIPCNSLSYAFTWPSRGILRFATFWKP